MTDQPVDPKAVADAVLTAVVAGFTALSIDLPARQVVIAGIRPAWDTDQLTVAPQRIYLGPPGAQAARTVAWQHDVFSMTLEVQLVRKAAGTLANSPRKQFPSAASIGADATVYFADMRALAGSLHTAKKTGSIRAGQGKVVIGVVQPFEQQGEYVGMGCQLDVALF